MIMIIKKTTGKKTMFKNYQACWKHIRAVESNRRANPVGCPLDTWIFARHSMRRVSAFHQYACHVRKKHRQNPNQSLLKLDVLEICLDRAQKPLLIPLMPDIDPQDLLEDWCRLYFQFHGYEFFDDIEAGEVNTKPS